MSNPVNPRMTDTERAAAIRAALRSELGATGRDISVRMSGCSAIYVTIKVARFAKAEVEKIANRFRCVSYCSVTGDILSGGNTFVFTEYASGMFDEAAAAIAKEFDNRKELRLSDRYRLVSIGHEFAIVDENGFRERWAATLVQATRMAAQVRSEESVRLAREIEDICSDWAA